MTSKRLRLWTAALACAIVVLTSCSRVVVRSAPAKKVGHGPPAHAPAHGHRRKLPQGVEVVYDSGRGVYVVVGLENHYYCGGYYYRLCNSQWQISASIDSGWKVVAVESLPSGLSTKAVGKVSKSHPGRGWGTQKDKW